MPITNGRYVNPGWVNETAPGISAQEMNAISDSLERVPIANGGTNGTTVAEARNNLGLGNTDGALPIANGGTGARSAQDARANLGFSNGVVQINLGGTGATNAADARRNLGFTGNSGALPISLGGTGATTAEGARIALGLNSPTGTLPIANGGTGATSAQQARINLGFNVYGGVVPVSLGGTGATSAQSARINLGFKSNGDDGILPVRYGGTGMSGIENSTEDEAVHVSQWGKVILLTYRQQTADTSEVRGISTQFAPRRKIHLICPLYRTASASSANPMTNGYGCVFIDTDGTITVTNTVSGCARFDVTYLTYLLT